MTKWHLRYTKSAGTDLAFFINHYPAIWDEIKRILALLAEEDDPRRPKHPDLTVGLIEHDAPGWWKVYVGQPGPLWVRVIFSLFATRNNSEVKIERLDKVDEFDEPKAIEITYAAFRKDAYGKRLRERYKSR